jgi:hypothetical protein
MTNKTRPTALDLALAAVLVGLALAWSPPAALADARLLLLDDAGDPPAELINRKTIIDVMKQEARALDNVITTDTARAFIRAVDQLPLPEPRTIYHDAETSTYLSARDAEPIFEEEAARLREINLTADRYYITRYGTPLAYARAIDLAAAHGLTFRPGLRTLDIGYGGIGPLRLLAANGCHAVGVDVDSFLSALYDEASDQGAFGEGPSAGTVTMIDGAWPGDASTRTAVGTGFEFIVSKNTLKRGYVHPEREVDPKKTIDLGVKDAEYVRALHDALAPGGLIMIYNICPPLAKDDEPYVPWADGRCPFDESLLRETGFEVIAYNRNDDAAVRDMGVRLGWGTPADLESSFFAMYTILRKPVGDRSDAETVTPVAR